ncbi:hypothetical protein IFM89_020114 [Coptis chinensis]|uniref:Uncharacterized protein n=1 Tax=Coptis chinensis TaxID=261450 RepID=A0A835MFH0_9MAGN|nr:hypothetical protein IFM89_020114 [Coptis chinensis]
MYGGGDCQVMTSTLGGGNVGVSSDSLFDSPIRNPNHHFNFICSNLPFHHNPFSTSLIPKEEGGLQTTLRRGGKEEEMESGSVSGLVVEETADGEQDQDNEQLLLLEQQEQPKKKRYHRHTVRQIQEMEALFKECPHPDDKQRMKLSQELGLKPRQVKFWFQNRRTQMKAQQDKSENVILRAENENLKNEGFRLQAALRSISCPNCGGPAILGEMSFDEQHLRIENVRLKEELERLSGIASRYSCRPIHALGPPAPLLLPSVDLNMNIYAKNFQEQIGICTDMVPVLSMQHNSNLAGWNQIMEHDKHLAIEFAINAIDELIKMCQMSDPLWVRNSNGTKEILNMEEHAKMFPWSANFKQHKGEFRTEATRDSVVVIMNSVTLADAFLDVNKWMDLFPSIVSSAKTVQTITSGISSHPSGSLNLMYAELQFLSPLVPTREAHFLRYCHQNVEEGTWAIVDFPFDSFQDSFQHSLPRYQRRPSGCIIQDMPNGYSRVTWVEHAEVEDKQVHPIFNHFVKSGMAFGASRWLAVLQQQCERLASLMARNISDLGVIPSPEARKNLMKLAQRMIRRFCFNISTSGGQSWTAISDSADETVRITTRKNVEPGQPNGLILCAVSSTCLPFSHQQVFDLLRDERRRSQFDVLSSGTSSHEVAHIANGSHSGNCISVLRINVRFLNEAVDFRMFLAPTNSSQNVELMLQESSTDQFSSLVVYSTIDVDAVQLAMSGEDPSYIALLPLGFVVTPLNNRSSITNSGDSIKSPDDGNSPTPSCLLTVGLQVLVSTITSAKINLSNVTSINSHLCNVVQQITSALRGGSLSETTLKSED